MTQISPSRQVLNDKYFTFYSLLYENQAQERFEESLFKTEIENNQTTSIPELKLTQEFDQCMSDFRQKMEENAAPPMDPETVETIKEIMKGIPFPEHAIPLWAKRIPEKLWIPRK